jgi:very-short-patch-repair endonuclease
VGHRWQRFLSEAAKFLTVGGLATLVSFVIFNGLVHGYVDGPGPMHDQPDKQADDAAADGRLEDLGWSVVRFHH